MSASWSVLIIMLLSVKIVCSVDIEKDVKLRFYHGYKGKTVGTDGHVFQDYDMVEAKKDLNKGVLSQDSFINYTELPIQRAEEIMSTSWYKKDRETVFFTHGFQGIPTGPAVTAVINAYLKTGCNIALLNWELLAGELSAHSIPNSYFSWAAPNGKMVGARFADTLMDLIKAGVDLNNTHLVGHSLGAQIFGITGNTLAARGIRIQRITGLDPTHFGFDNKPPSSRLHPGSAVFVAAIHTDPDKYGMAKSIGTVDFWPNFKVVGVVAQPGCREGGRPEILSAENKCSHDRSWQLFVDALNYPGSILGSHAISYKAWKRYRKEQRLAVVLDIGSYHPNIVPGNYFFYTKAASPFGLGVNGL